MRNTIRKSEVISFLEDKLSMNIATQDELELYENYRWNGRFEKNHTYKNLVKQINKLWNEKF